MIKDSRWFNKRFGKRFEKVRRWLKIIIYIIIINKGRYKWELDFKEKEKIGIKSGIKNGD